LPYVKGSTVVATDEEGDPLYEDVGPTPRFLALSRRHLHDLSAGEATSRNTDPAAINPCGSELAREAVYQDIDSD
jgi:hypothetical protein